MEQPYQNQRTRAVINVQSVLHEAKSNCEGSIFLLVYCDLCNVTDKSITMWPASPLLAGLLQTRCVQSLVTSQSLTAPEGNMLTTDT